MLFIFRFLNISFLDLISEKIKWKKSPMIQNFPFQILLSASIGPILLYLTLRCWVYPMKDYIGETGCHIRAFLVKALGFIVQLQSFFTTIFRYICVFHNGSILNLNLSPYVSSLAVMILFSIIQKNLDLRNCDLERLLLKPIF